LRCRCLERAHARSAHCSICPVTPQMNAPCFLECTQNRHDNEAGHVTLSHTRQGQTWRPTGRRSPADWGMTTRTRAPASRFVLAVSVRSALSDCQDAPAIALCSPALTHGQAREWQRGSETRQPLTAHEHHAQRYPRVSTAEWYQQAQPSNEHAHARTHLARCRHGLNIPSGQTHHICSFPTAPVHMRHRLRGFWESSTCPFRRSTLAPRTFLNTPTQKERTRKEGGAT